jgi:MFS family permease
MTTIDGPINEQNAAEAGRYPAFRWYILATLCAVVAVQGMALIGPAPLVGEIMKTIPGISAGEATWMTMGSWNLAVAISAIGSGFVLERVGFTRLYIAGLAVILLGWLLMPVFGTTFMGGTLVRLLQAIGAGPIMASAVYVAAICFPSRERNLVTGFFGAAMFIGIATALQIVPNSLGPNTDWAQALRNLWPFAAVAIVMAIIAWAGLRKLGISEIAARRAGGGQAAHSQALFLQALRMPITWVAIIGIVLASWFDQAYSDMVPGFIALPIGLGLGAGAAGTLSSIATIGQIISAILVGFIVERLLKGHGRVTAILGFVLAAAGSFLLLTPLAHSDGLLGVLLVITFFKAWINPSIQGFIAKEYDAAVAGKLGGFSMGIGIFGGLAGVSAGSTALHLTNSYTASTLIMALIAVAGVVLMLFLRSGKASAAKDAAAQNSDYVKQS